MGGRRPNVMTLELKATKTERLKNDRYFTPAWVVRQAVDYVVPRICRSVGRIIDPGTGAGAFTQYLRLRYPDVQITAIDIEPFEWPEANVRIVGDFMTASLDRYDLAIGNPPYSLAMPFISKSLEIADHSVMLLRQGFLSSARRNAFFRLHRPSDVFILAHRPCFSGDTSDKADYCFVCWGARSDGFTRLHWMPTIPLSDRRLGSP